jgi:hypothetical protein
MQKIKIVKRYVFLLILIATSYFANAVPSTNFLPLEDGYSVLRDDNADIYGASVTSIKPHRQALITNSRTNLQDSFLGSTDVLICVLLLGIYTAFTHKRSQTRNIDL